MQRAVFFLWLLTAGTTLCAQKIRYNVQSCTLSVEDKFKIQSVVALEAAYFAEVFGPKKLSTIFINVYGTRKLYQKKDPPPGSAGFYRPGTRNIYVLYTGDYLQSCYHEASHAMFDVFAKHRPTWINEGIATYFEYALVDTAGQVKISVPKWRKEKMRGMVKDGDLNISRLLKFKHLRFHIWREQRNYTLSWGIVYYLMTVHREKFGTILYRVGTGMSSTLAINQEYPGGIEQLEKDLVQYYR